MESMGALMGTFVFLLLVVPMAVLVVGMMVWILTGFLLPSSATIARASFRCPFSKRSVHAEFLGRPGTEQPVDVVSCSAFREPRRIQCDKACLGLVVVHGVSAMLQPRYSLVADGVAYRKAA